MPPDRPSTLSVHGAAAAVTAIYLVVAGSWALTGGNLEFLLYIGVIVLLIPLIWAVDRRAGLTRGAVWALSIWGLVHMAGGLLPVPGGWPIHGEEHVLYNLWIVTGRLKYDQLVHAYGFGVTAWVCWQGLCASIGGAARPTLGRLLLCWAGGMGFGALNEVIEFAATLLVPETNVGGYRNTGWDLVANTVGVTVAVTIIRLGARSGAIRSLPR